MKYVSFRSADYQSYGVLVDGGIVDARRVQSEAPATLRGLLCRDDNRGLEGDLLQAAPHHPLDAVELLPVIPDPQKIVCVGLNYAAHRDESGRPEADFPSIFFRFADTQVGHDGRVPRPSVSNCLDYEGELAVVIGRQCHRVPADRALDYVSGYSCYNDFSVRDWQRHNSQWGPGKNFPGTGAFGPALVTHDEAGDPQGWDIETRVNGQIRQSANTKDMLFSVAELIAYISTFTCLSPGDVIVTGTPSGVGDRRNPPSFLAPGDVVEVEIDSLGVLRNEIV